MINRQADHDTSIYLGTDNMLHDRPKPARARFDPKLTKIDSEKFKNLAGVDAGTSDKPSNYTLRTKKHAQNSQYSE
jgi:hypothetical protein